MLRAKLPFFLAYARARQQPIFIDYIESDGNQYIDTGIIQSPNQKFEIVTQPLSLDNNQAFFGSQNSSNYMYLGAYASYPGWIVQYGGGSDYFDYGKKDLNKHTFVLDLLNLTLNVDDVSYDISAHSTAISGAHSVWLFARNDNGNGRTLYTGRVYDYKAYENGELVQHLRPCLHPQTFEACMYDTVTKQYFYNKGTGSFIPAPRFVEYIESDSTAYIDTGIAGGKDTLTVECKFMYNAFVSYGGIYGNYVSDSHDGIRCILANSGNRIITNNNTICTTSGNTELDCNISQIHTVISKHDTVILDGVTTSIQNTEIGTENANNVALFNRSVTNPNTSRDISLRVYDFKISENDTLLRHLRPCLRGNTPCMFDMVEGKYYMNAGTGTFNYGEIKFVDYIGSTGTQYISLGYISPERAKTLRFVADMSIDTTSSGYRLCGTGGNKRQLYFGLNPAGAFAYGPGSIDATVDSYGKGGIKYHYDYDVLNGLYEVSENSAIVASNQFEFSGYIGGNFCLFCYAGVGEVPTALWSGKIYSFLVYENNMLIQDLRPALDYNNVACMYDMVTGNYFYNQGTGEFIAG